MKLSTHWYPVRWFGVIGFAFPGTQAWGWWVSQRDLGMVEKSETAVTVGDWSPAVQPVGSHCAEFSIVPV
jgi:hypothetical protein